MLHSGCPTNTQLLAPPPDLDAVEITSGKNDRKASIDLETGKVLIDEEFLRSLDDDALDAVLFHEMAHTQPSGCARHCEGKPDGCERCADNRLGACLALRGFTRERASSAVQKMHVSRSTLKADALAGFDAARSSVRNLQLPPPTMKQLPSPVSQLPSDPFVFDTPFKPIPPPVEVPTKPGKPSTPKETESPTIDTPTVDKPSACPCKKECDCHNGNYDFSWVVGVAGGVLSFSILATRWALS